MKFNKGDKVICIHKPHPSHYQIKSYPGDTCIGKMFTVMGVGESDPFNIKLSGEYGWFDPNNFKLKDINPPKNDVEWLDRIKQNFQDGI